jgi:hypothetical protein
MNENRMKQLHEVFDEQGYTLPNWKIKLVGEELIRNHYGKVVGDWMWIDVEIYKCRCRKPIQKHHIFYNHVKKQIDMSRSSFINF